MGQSKSMGWMIVEIMKRVRTLYEKEKGAFPEGVLNHAWPDEYDAEEVARQINGVFTRDVTIKGKSYKKGDQVPGFVLLRLTVPPPT